jgi:hypothetical protein
MSDEKETGKAMVDRPSTKTLYVIFHGEIFFFDSGIPDDPIKGFAPAMEMHVYSAGPWLEERRIPGGFTLGLSPNVQSGKMTFAQSGDVTLLFKGAQPDKPVTEEPAYMKLILPRPDNIFSGERVAINFDSIQVGNAPAPAQTSDSCSALSMIFQYSVEEGDAPSLTIIEAPYPMPDLKGWNCGTGPDGCYILHVFAEADVVVNNAHITEASRKGAALIGIDLQLTPTNVEAHNKVLPPPGLLCQDVNQTLAARLDEMALLGDWMRGLPPGESPRFRRTEVIGGPGSCGPGRGIPDDGPNG